MLEFPHRRSILVYGRGVVGVADLVEAVHVELPDETGDVAVLEVARQRIGKLFAGVEGKGVGGVVGPPYELGKLGVIEHGVELVHEGVLLDGRILLLTHWWRCDGVE